MFLINYILFVLLVILLINISGFSLKEGVTFTPYDNTQLLNNHWDEFCINNPVPCDENKPSLLIDREPEIGCWCKNQKSIFNNQPCSDIYYDPFIEFRR